MPCPFARNHVIQRINNRNSSSLSCLAAKGKNQVIYMHPPRFSPNASSIAFHLHMPFNSARVPYAFTLHAVQFLMVFYSKCCSIPSVFHFRVNSIWTKRMQLNKEVLSKPLSVLIRLLNALHKLRVLYLQLMEVLSAHCWTPLQASSALSVRLCIASRRQFLLLT